MCNNVYNTYYNQCFLFWICLGIVLDWTRKQLFTTEFLQFDRCQKILDWSKNILDLQKDTPKAFTALTHDIVTGEKVKTKPSCHFRHLKVQELEFQPHLPRYWVRKWSVKSHHGLQWSASNYFSLVQLKTRPKVSKIRLLKHHPTPSRFF